LPPVITSATLGGVVAAGQHIRDARRRGLLDRLALLRLLVDPCRRFLGAVDGLERARIDAIALSRRRKGEAQGQSGAQGRDDKTSCPHDVLRPARVLIEVSEGHAIRDSARGYRIAARRLKCNRMTEIE